MTSPSPKLTPKFDIEFKVPCRVAVQDVTIQSNESWTLFVIKVSEVMGCLHNMMPSLSYISSWKPAQGKPVPKILDGLETLAKLIKDITTQLCEVEVHEPKPKYEVEVTK